MNPNNWVIHKFGGTSVGNASCMRKCVEIIKPLCVQQRVAVVVSAMGGKPKVTDLLLDLVNAAAASKKSEIEQKSEMIRCKHRECLEDILKPLNAKVANEILDKINNDLQDIFDLLRAVQMMRMAHEQILELVSGYGELWSAQIMSEVMKLEGLPFIFVNARDVLFVSELDTIGTKVHWEESENKLNQYLLNAEENYLSNEEGKKLAMNIHPIKPPHLMITGYIASTLDGIATTLKRDGSDFSASIFGKMLRADHITIWTDVSGVYSADPRRVPEAQIIPEVTYTEAIELAYFGAKVIHPKTMAPAIMSKIPIYIRNTFDPSNSGTRIYVSASPTGTEGIITNRRERTVCGFTTTDNIALLNIEGTGMIGVPGIAHRVFGAIKTSNVPVMFIAQASSEHSICFATKQIYAEKAREAIEKNFFYELKQQIISQVTTIKDCSIIAAVGESMQYMPGVAGLFFGALGGASISVLSISQGCDERNISAVVHSRDATRALRAVHSAFWLSSLDLSVGMVGTGRVGTAVLKALIEQFEILGLRFGLNIKIRGLANSRSMILGDDLCEMLKGKYSEIVMSGGSVSPSIMRKNHSNVSLTDLEQLLDDTTINNTPFALNGTVQEHSTVVVPDYKKQATNLDTFLSHVKTVGGNPHAVIIDCSTSDYVASLHSEWLKHGAHVVTANKRALSSSLDLYNSVFSEARINNKMYMSEVTIGASLPVRTTLNDILCSGDAVHSIVGLMSVSAGTILTDMCDEKLTFTQALVRTYQKGLFEDDVFKDLEGIEAAEKLLILGRELGYPLNIDDIHVESLATRRDIPSWNNPGDAFRKEDSVLAARVQLAKQHNCTLRYVQRIVCNPPAELGSKHNVGDVFASVRLEEVPLDSNHALVKGAVYHFSFHTDRYSQNPLIVQGPLSDAANTASGVVGDILRIARSIGAKDKGPEALLR